MNYQGYPEYAPLHQPQYRFRRDVGAGGNEPAGQVPAGLRFNPEAAGIRPGEQVPPGEFLRFNPEAAGNEPGRHGPSGEFLRSNPEAEGNRPVPVSAEGGLVNPGAPGSEKESLDGAETFGWGWGYPRYRTYYYYPRSYSSYYYPSYYSYWW